METEFIESLFPIGFQYEFDPYLFNLPENLTLQSKNGWRSFYAVRSDKKVIKAHVHFHCDGNKATSPYKNPFGSFEFSDTFAPNELFDFILFVENALKKEGIQRIEIKSYPQLYDAGKSALLTTFLINNHFKIDSSELSASIQVSPFQLDESLSLWEKRKLKQQKKTKLTFKRLGLNEFEKIFKFIESCRKERNQTLSMSGDQLKKVSLLFNERFYLFAMFDEETLTAASIAIRINQSILYNFYSAHAKQYDTLSPVVGLIEGMYQFCQEEKISLLDLGTSSSRNKPNFSLLNFKMNLGAQPTSKFTFCKDL